MCLISVSASKWLEARNFTHSDHGGGHTIADEENDVLGLAVGGTLVDLVVGDSLVAWNNSHLANSPEDMCQPMHTVVVLEIPDIFTRLIERELRNVIRRVLFL